MKAYLKKLKIYVPQESYLIDDTFKNNIVFPVQNFEIDDLKIAEAVGLKFTSKISKKENTMIGEKV